MAPGCGIRDSATRGSLAIHGVGCRTATVLAWSNADGSGSRSADVSATSSRTDAFGSNASRSCADSTPVIERSSVHRMYTRKSCFFFTVDLPRALLLQIQRPCETKRKHHVCHNSLIEETSLKPRSRLALWP